jgi:predicted phosphodiesterase
MRYAIFSDIHGNLDAYLAILEDIKDKGIDRKICLGDLVGYGPEPIECIDKTIEEGIIVIAGNHDIETVRTVKNRQFNKDALRTIELTREILQQKGELYLKFLTSLNNTHNEEFFHCAHANIRKPVAYEYVLDTVDAKHTFKDMEKSLLFIGHTHVPIIFVENKIVREIDAPDHIREPMDINKNRRYIINVGSVGQPRDHDPRACYVIFDDETHKLTYQRVLYDVERVINKIRFITVNGKAFPNNNWTRLYHGK